MLYGQTVRPPSKFKIAFLLNYFLDESGQNGTQKVNIYKDQDFSNDAPPPIPPRPPDLIRDRSPSPPPPPNLPPPGIINYY